MLSATWRMRLCCDNAFSTMANQQPFRFRRQPQPSPSTARLPLFASACTACSRLRAVLRPVVGCACGCVHAPLAVAPCVACPTWCSALRHMHGCVLCRVRVDRAAAARVCYDVRGGSCGTPSVQIADGAIGPTTDAAIFAHLVQEQPASLASRPDWQVLSRCTYVHAPAACDAC